MRHLDGAGSGGVVSRARRFHVTYDSVTPESAADGDAADCGYLDKHGFLCSVMALHGASAAAVARDCALTLREALALFGERYGRHGVEVDRTTFRQSDAAPDFATGAEITLTLHVPFDMSGASFSRLRRIVQGAD